MFEPYIGKHGIGDIKFFFATPEAVAWYDPLKPYTLLEYEWVRDNVKMRGQYVIDAGCHHGNYSVVFKWLDAYVIAVDAHKSNCDIAEMNLRYDFYEDTDNVEVVNAAVTPLDGGLVGFSGVSNGQIVKSGGVQVWGRKLSSFENKYQKISVVKIDIEGSEFAILPQEIDDLPSVHTWIVEIHPNAGDPNTIAQAFVERGFELLKVDRERMVVRPYVLGERWLTHATLIARRAA